MINAPDEAPPLVNSKNLYVTEVAPTITKDLIKAETYEVMIGGNDPILILK